MTATGRPLTIDTTATGVGAKAAGAALADATATCLGNSLTPLSDPERARASIDVSHNLRQRSNWWASAGTEAVRDRADSG